MRRTALITGIHGQDGSFLAELLLARGYEVHGVCRRSLRHARPGTPRGAQALRSAGGPGEPASFVRLHAGDVLDPISLRRIINVVKPTEVYNLAAQSHVQGSFCDPVYSANVIAIGTLCLLEALRDYRDSTGVNVRFYQAGSSEMFGRAAAAPQNEQTPFRPTTPYGCAKLHAYWQTVTYREAHGLHACNGILYNHESPRRPVEYVTRKITRAAARIRLGLEDELLLGNLDARRDWGYAADYVEAMWRMLQHPQPDDFVIASGESRSVREFLAAAFGAVSLDWRSYVRVDERFLRPAEPTQLCGDATRARRILGWKPTVDFRGLVQLMVTNDLRLAERELAATTAAARS